MQQHPLDIARRHGLIQTTMDADITRIIIYLPAATANRACLAATLRGLGYSDGEIDVRLSMSPERPS